MQHLIDKFTELSVIASSSDLGSASAAQAANPVAHVFAGPSLGTGVVRRSVAASSCGVDVNKPLAFVDRDVEAFEIMVANCRNKVEEVPDGLGDSGTRRKRKPYIAFVPQPTGKTALDANVLDILRRPRIDRDKELQLAERLSSTWSVNQRPTLQLSITAALSVPSLDGRNLIVRTLEIEFPTLAKELSQFVSGTDRPIVVTLTDLPSPTQMGAGAFEEALTFSVYCAMVHADTASDNSKAFGAFKALSAFHRGSPAALLKAVIDHVRRPIFVVFDEVTALASPTLEGYFHREGKHDALYNALSAFSFVISKIQSVTGCYTVCTGLAWCTVKEVP
jgi:hypothetical protein